MTKWKLEVKYKDGSGVTVRPTKKHVSPDSYKHYWTKSNVASAMLQYYPLKDNQLINLLEVKQ